MSAGASGHEVAQAAAQAQRRLAAELAAAAPQVPAAYPLESYLARLESGPALSSYRHVPPDAGAWSDEIERTHGPEALDLYHRMLLAHLIAHHEQRLASLAVPQSIASLLLRTFQRILRGFDHSEANFYRHENDLFAKDLALCRLKLLPCGSELLDLRSGVPRRLLLASGPGQFLRALAFFAVRSGGLAPWYESHWDRRLIREFTPAAYDQCYVRMAEMLERNPGVRGVMSSSWWFDPALESISPTLAFLRTVPERGGARLFRVGEDEQASRDALLRSPERTRAHAEGSYRPTVYMLAWARDDMIAWARASASG